MDSVTTGMTALIGFIGDVFTAMTSNPIIAIYLAGGVLVLAIGLFGYLKRKAK